MDELSLTWHDLFVYGAKGGSNRKRILDGLEGTLSSGEMLLVLGKPGSGCTTFLKTLAGRLEGLSLDPASELAYRAKSQQQVEQNVKGKCVYMAESDVHFPDLTVGQTLEVAKKAGSRTTRGDSKDTLQDLVQSLRLTDALNTNVGNHLIPGCSGGERKRVSIAEIMLSDSPIQCWDSPTRGLDSENAAIFVKTIRQQCTSSGSIAIVSLFQASEEIMSAFDKVALLYEGQQIFFGTSEKAKDYFQRLGFHCEPRVSTSDFMMALTDPRLHASLLPGFEKHNVPSTSKQFKDIWYSSPERTELLQAIRTNKEKFTATLGWKSQAKAAYRIPYLDQVSLCLNRGFHRLLLNLGPTISTIVGNLVMSIILGSMFYNMAPDTNSFYGRGVLVFFITLTNTFLGAFEAVALWGARPIVEKHKNYGLYRPSAEALASMIVDLPNKILLTTVFNIPFYFLANMRRTPGAFFTFYLFSFFSLLTGSMLFRTIGGVSRRTATSIAPGATFIILLVIYTGFVLPIPDMPVWLGWFRYINPIAHAFESLMLNEFAGRQFACSSFVPGTNTCAVVGGGPDSPTVDGTTYLFLTYQYKLSHKWRNLGWIIIIMVVLCVCCLVSVEYVTMKYSTGEIMVYKGEGRSRKKKDDTAQYSTTSDLEAQLTPGAKEKQEQHGSFLWRHLTCKLEDQKTKITKEILSNVDGWILPGTMTALMGASGAGKTTLLNILAERPSVGVVSGLKMIDQIYQDESFTRKVGFAQQQDLHLSTMTVREAFTFSALLRQSPKYTKQEKLDLVDTVIQDLDMVSIQHAIIGSPGSGVGLNEEQRKKVTIGIELVARPELLLFLDEPTSGLDSNTAWSICRLLRKLSTQNGQTILCTIHQPSTSLLQMFDRLLVLQRGKTIYFGDVGQGACEDLVSYFETRGARACQSTENPAEWMLKVIDSDSTKPWTDLWLESDNYKECQKYLDTLQARLSTTTSSSSSPTKTKPKEFAAPFTTQLLLTTTRNILNDYRTPVYVASKLLLTAGCSLVNGFSFYKSPHSLQGTQNSIFSIFLVFLLHSNMIQIILPQFISNRSLFESRERLSRTYSWPVFILSNFLSEIPWQTMVALVQFVGWYFPLGFYNGQSEKAGLMFLVIWSFAIFSSTISQLMGCLLPDEATGINIGATLWSLSLIFCGVLVRPSTLPKFWIFMYRVTPVTYLLSTMVSAGIARNEITCSAKEIVTVAFSNSTAKNCQEYLGTYLKETGAAFIGEVEGGCQLCPISSTDQILAMFKIFYSERWRNYGISIVFPVVNVLLALIIYRGLRVKKVDSQNDGSGDKGGL
ncbi:ABC-2 type transporter-domain-containing protein [Podospora fimiseda]|uniref:ABC-2 type transporter-domain-containing protein n=1 Tax=Podospora fimiseda TaxID=252190 RepID=A0AAN7BKH8_9PEZI|nr:ABC-2 type transporter-domain-containing protein [Podospora fimiseda]